MYLFEKTLINVFNLQGVSPILIFFVLSDLAVDLASSVIPQNYILNAPFISGVQRQFSRYFNEFEELQLLGKGAFGAVIKVSYSFTERDAISPLPRLSLSLSLCCASRFRTNWTAAITL